MERIYCGNTTSSTPTRIRFGSHHDERGFFLISEENVSLDHRKGSYMSTATFDEERLKDLLKSALVEALEENRSLVQDIVEEALEDIALARAIDQGLNSGSGSRAEVFSILEGEQ